MTRFAAVTFAAALALGAGPATAHVTLETPQAAVGSFYKAVFRVPHGCHGKPTIALRVKVPEGFIGAKPQPKPGWSLDKTKGKYAKAYSFIHGLSVDSGLTEVAWRGGSLPDDEYDEFVLNGYLAADLKPGTVLYFPVVQECPDGAAERWIAVPEHGKDAGAVENPAPGLALLPKP